MKETEFAYNLGLALGKFEKVIEQVISEDTDDNLAGEIQEIHRLLASAIEYFRSTDDKKPIHYGRGNADWIDRAVKVPDIPGINDPSPEDI